MWLKGNDRLLEIENPRFEKDIGIDLELNHFRLTAKFSAILRISRGCKLPALLPLATLQPITVKMPRETGPSLNERQFFQKALEENLRIDGRAFDQFRALELEFGDEYGVADVRLGKTRFVSPLLGLYSSTFTKS